MERSIMDLIATARPIDRLHEDTWNNRFPDIRLKGMVTMNKADIRAKGWCYIHTDDEFVETIKCLCKYHTEDVIIEGEVYKGIIKLYGVLKPTKKRKR